MEDKIKQAIMEIEEAEQVIRTQLETIFNIMKRTKENIKNCNSSEEIEEQMLLMGIKIKNLEAEFDKR